MIPDQSIYSADCDEGSCKSVIVLSFEACDSVAARCMEARLRSVRYRAAIASRMTRVQRNAQNCSVKSASTLGQFESAWLAVAPHSHPSSCSSSVRAAASALLPIHEHASSSASASSIGKRQLIARTRPKSHAHARNSVEASRPSRHAALPRAVRCWARHFFAFDQVRYPTHARYCRAGEEASLGAPSTCNPLATLLQPRPAPGRARSQHRSRPPRGSY